MVTFLQTTHWQALQWLHSRKPLIDKLCNSYILANHGYILANHSLTSSAMVTFSQTTHWQALQKLHSCKPPIDKLCNGYILANHPLTSSAMVTFLQTTHWQTLQWLHSRKPPIDKLCNGYILIKVCLRCFRIVKKADVFMLLWHTKNIRIGTFVQGSRASIYSLTSDND